MKQAFKAQVHLMDHPAATDHATSDWPGPPANKQGAFIDNSWSSINHHTSPPNFCSWFHGPDTPSVVQITAREGSGAQHLRSVRRLQGGPRPSPLQQLTASAATHPARPRQGAGFLCLWRRPWQPISPELIPRFSPLVHPANGP